MPVKNGVLQHVTETNKLHENAPVWNFTFTIWEGSYSFLLHIVQAFGWACHLIDSNMSGTDVTEDVMNSIKWKQKTVFVFDVVIVIFNLCIVQSLILMFSIYMVTY